MRNKTANVATKGKLLKTGEVADLLHVSAQTVRDWTEAGKLEAVTSESGHRTYYEADVKRYSLESKGITSYLQLGHYVALAADGSIHLINDSYETANPEMKVVPFAQYWDFTNALQKQPHQVALNDGVASIVWEHALELSPVMLCESDGQVMLFLPVMAVGLEEQDVTEQFAVAVQIAADYLKANFVAKPTVKWFNNDGEPVQY